MLRLKCRKSATGFYLAHSYAKRPLDKINRKGAKI